ncbi:MAG TPA: hypothetical protein VF792_04700 [Ktedonobacterales bacterium]
MTPHTDLPHTPSTGEPPVTHATPMQRMGVVALSLFFLIFLVNIMSALAPAFGALGSAIVIAAICLLILGVNVAFNLDLLRSRR